MTEKTWENTISESYVLIESVEIWSVMLGWMEMMPSKLKEVHRKIGVKIRVGEKEWKKELTPAEGADRNRRKNTNKQEQQENKIRT